MQQLLPSRESGRNVLVSGSQAIEAYKTTLNLDLPTVDQLHEYFRSLSKPDFAKVAQSVNAQFFHTLENLSEAYVCKLTSQTQARITILPCC